MQHLRNPLLLILLAFTLTITGCGGSGGNGGNVGGGATVTGGAIPVAPEAPGTTAGTNGTLTKQPAVQLSWEGSTEADGSPSQTLGGYKVSYGTEPGKYTSTIDVGKATTCTINELPPATYYFSVSAYDIWGSESPMSNEATKQVK